MQKFPILNNMRQVYALLSVLILIGGAILSIWGGYSAGENGGNAAIVSIGGFVVSIYFAAQLMLTSELISLSLRVEDHLEHLRYGGKEIEHVAVPDIVSRYDQEDEIEVPRNTSPNAPMTSTGLIQDFSMNFRVQVSDVSLYEDATTDSDVIGHISKNEEVAAVERNNKGDWVFVESIDHEESQGWVRVAEIGTTFSAIRDLPVS